MKCREEAAVTIYHQKMAMTAIDELLRRNVDSPRPGTPTIITPVPSLHLTIVTCMDARIKVFDVFGLKHGEAHILRNAAWSRD